MEKEAAFLPGADQRNLALFRTDVLKLDTRCLFAGRLSCAEGWEEKTHAHPFCEIMFVLSGEGEITVKERNYTVRHGDIIVYNPSVEHSERATADAGVEFAFFGISNFKIGELPTDFLIDDLTSPVLHTGDEERYSLYFRSLVEEISSDQPYNELMVKYWARLILIGVLRLANISEAKFVTNATFTRIHEYLTNHFSEISCMDQICETLGINKYYLSHVFKKYMGTPPMQYVTLRRITHAKRLLRETELPASAVAEACGYQDRVLFFKAFRKLENMTPGEFRRHARGDRLPKPTDRR